MNASSGRFERNARIAIVILALAGAGQAMANDDYGWLVGANAGVAKLNDFRFQTTSKADTGTVGSIFGGYQFTRYFALAGGYIDLGKYNFQGTTFGGYNQTIKVDGFQLAGVGNLPVAERVGLTGTLGAFRWDYKFSEPANPATGDPARSLSDSGVSPTVGLGVNIDIFSKRGSYLHIGWQRFFKVGRRETVEHENDFDLFLIGIVYNFSKLQEGGMRK